MRFWAIGPPMIPNPMNPTFSAISSPLSKPQVRNLNILAAQLFGQPAKALLGLLRRGGVLEAHVAVVAQLLQNAKDVSVVDLTRPRLPPPRGVGDLDVPHHIEVLPEVSGQVTLHPLHLEEVVLDLHVLAAHAPYELDRLLRRIEQIRAIIERAQRLHHDL